MSVPLAKLKNQSKPRRQSIWNWLALAACLPIVAAGPIGCGPEWDATFGKKEQPPPPSEPTTADVRWDTKKASYAFKDTIGSYCVVEGMRRMRVRGYGLVIGLGTKGSSSSPENVRKDLIDEISKRFSQRAYGLRSRYSPEELIDSEDTAIVLVEAQIPALLKKGGRFDVFVSTLPGTEVESLEGGQLFTCDLKLYADAGSGVIREGQTLAHAAGPVFINPFAQDDDAATKVNPRRGRIIKGGTNFKDRRVSLLLVSPSYQRAIRIARRINGKFTSSDKVADAFRKGKINLRVPAEFDGREKHFIDLINHLFLSSSDGFNNRRAQKLVEELIDPGGPHEDISLCWEVFGKEVLDIIRPLYTDRRRHVSFYAARTGLRLLDEPAENVLAKHANDPQSPFRLKAIEELGLAGYYPSTARLLEPLLDDQDPRVRIAAYEALRERRSDKIQRLELGMGARLDVLDTEGPGLLYATINDAPRLALFGKHLTCAPDVFYVHRDGAVTISCRSEDDAMTLLRVTPFLKIVSDPIKVDRNVDRLIMMLGNAPNPDENGLVQGVGMTYSQVVEIMSTLCREGYVPAQFRLQTPSIADIFGPLAKIGRPESEL